MPTTNQETAIDVDNDRDGDLDATIGNDAAVDAVEHDAIDDDTADDDARVVPYSLKNLLAFEAIRRSEYTKFMADPNRCLVRPPMELRFAWGDCLVAAVANYEAQDGTLPRGQWMLYERYERLATDLVDHPHQDDRHFWRRNVQWRESAIYETEKILEALKWIHSDGPEEAEDEEIHLESIATMDSYATAVSDVQIAKMFRWQTPDGHPDVRRVRVARKEGTPPPTIIRKGQAQAWPQTQPMSFAIREATRFMAGSGYHAARKEYLGY